MRSIKCTAIRRPDGAPPPLRDAKEGRRGGRPKPRPSANSAQIPAVANEDHILARRAFDARVGRSGRSWQNLETWRAEKDAPADIPGLVRMIFLRNDRRPDRPAVGTGKFGRPLFAHFHSGTMRRDAGAGNPASYAEVARRRAVQPIRAGGPSPPANSRLTHARPSGLPPIGLVSRRAR